MNYIFTYLFFLVVLVSVNLYFFYYLAAVNKSNNINLSKIKIDQSPNLSVEIEQQLLKLSNLYKVKNSKFVPIQANLVQAFNFTPVGHESLWNAVENWADDESLYPDKDRLRGQILRVMQTSQIALVDNAPKGTQLKLLLVLEGNQKLLFKPKRYHLSDIIPGVVYSGFDRHNSEVFAYYLAIVLNMKWISPSVIRKINVNRDIIPYATPGLKRTMVKNDKSGALCIYGKCYYCKINETVCPDDKGDIEGAAILYMNKQFRMHRSPWSRSYKSKKMEWELNNDYCKKIQKSMVQKRLLNLIDIAIFDFLIQNGDRHGYEVYRDKIVILDNGKGLGNPYVDVLDILAPLYQCCMITASTWQHMQLISGGSLTETIKLLASLAGGKLATEEHFQAVERRLLKVYAVIQYCFNKHGEPRVLKNINDKKYEFVYN